MSERFDPAAVTAAILAGGLGTRLRPVVADRPKVLAPVDDRPFVAYLLDRLAAAGLRRAVLCTGYRAHAVRAALGDRRGPLRLHYSEETRPMGTGGALRLALPLLTTDPVMAFNGDSYVDLDPAAYLEWFGRRGAPEAALALVEVPDAGRYGRVELDAADRIRAFEEKSGGGKPGWVNAGAYLLRRRAIAEISPRGPCSLEREALPALLERGVLGYRCRGRFIDIGTPQSYRRAGRFFGADPPHEGEPRP